MASARARLIFVDGPQRGDEVVLADNVVLAGRDPSAGVQFTEQYASRRQLRFELAVYGWTLENLSTNPIRVNGKKYKAAKKILLATGDVIAVAAETQILFTGPDDDPRDALDAYRQEHPAPAETSPREPSERPPSPGRPAGSDQNIPAVDENPLGGNPLAARMPQVCMNAVEFLCEADAEEPRLLLPDIQPHILTLAVADGYRQLERVALGGASQTDRQLGHSARGNRSRLDFPPHRLAGGCQCVDLLPGKSRKLQRGNCGIAPRQLDLFLKGDRPGEAHALHKHVLDLQRLPASVLEVRENIAPQRHSLVGVTNTVPVFIPPVPAFTPEGHELRETIIRSPDGSHRPGWLGRDTRRRGCENAQNDGDYPEAVDQSVVYHVNSSPSYRILHNLARDSRSRWVPHGHAFFLKPGSCVASRAAGVAINNIRIRVTRASPHSGDQIVAMMPWLFEPAYMV